MNNNSTINYKKGYTLSELIITVVLIGLIGLFLIMFVTASMQKKIKEDRISNIKNKISKSTDTMLIMSGMNGYSSTMDFVREYSKYFKVEKICDNNHIQDCWSTPKVFTITGNKKTEWKISDTKNAQAMQLRSDYNNHWDDTVGLISADGTHMILSYNLKCDISTTEGIKWDGDNSSSNKCIAVIFDYNGAKKPNTIGSSKNNDIFTVNAGGLGTSCTLEDKTLCF